MSQTKVSVGATRKWIFGINDNLSIEWKIPNEGFSMACWSDDYFVAINGKSIPPKVFIAQIVDGKRSSSFYLAGIPISWGISSDSSKGASLTLCLDIRDSLRTELRDLATGKLEDSKTTIKQVTSKKASVCPLPLPEDTLTFFRTAMHICSISPNLSILWRHDLKQDEHLNNVYRQYGVLTSKKSVRVFDKNSGAQLWGRSFKSEINGIGSGATLTISFANGKKDSLDIRTGVSKLKN
jgi:hypothetical protein